jgi:hypothetical protein
LTMMKSFPKASNFAKCIQFSPPKLKNGCANSFDR